jgi:GNAT superfamily N-acetyltransferase
MSVFLQMVSRFRRTLRSEGWTGVWKWIRPRLQNVICLEEEYLCLESDLTALEPRYTLRGKSVPIRLLTREDLPALSTRLRGQELRRTRRYLGSEHFGFGFGAFAGEKMIGHLGMKTQEYDMSHIRHRFDLGPRMVYSNGMVVDKEFRGRIVPGALLEYGLLYFKGRGYTRSITITKTTNAASLRLSGHLGFREIHRIVSRRVFMIRLRPRIVYTAPEAQASSADPPLRELTEQSVLSEPSKKEYTQDSTHVDR